MTSNNNNSQYYKDQIKRKTNIISLLNKLDKISNQINRSKNKDLENNTTTTTEYQTEKNQDTTILAVNIRYYIPKDTTDKSTTDIENLPDSVLLHIPERLLEYKNEDNYRDLLESFAYNEISKQTGFDVIFCQLAI